MGGGGASMGRFCFNRRHPPRLSIPRLPTITPNGYSNFESAYTIRIRYCISWIIFCCKKHILWKVGVNQRIPGWGGL